MTAPLNADIMQAVALNDLAPLNDNISALFATGAGAQAQGIRIYGVVNRIVKSVATGAVILPSVVSMEAPPLVIVLNDSPNSINVGAAAGEQMNGVATTSSFGAGIVTIAAAGAGIFFRSGSPAGIGGVGTASQLNWHGAAMT